jgi:3',5'-cyclic AMP phosphodiesterase CpdA
VASEVATFATLNDLHFGEPMVGGVLTDDMESGGEAQPGFPLARAEDTDEPYWRFMNEDAIDEINESGVDCAFVKGDIADRGQPWQFEEAARAFARFAMPHHAFLGNHDYLAKQSGDDVDGYALLGQPSAPRSVELAGWQLVLLETSLPGEHHGVFEADRLEWLADTLSGRQSSEPTLVLMHHQPVPPEHRDRYPNTIGLEPEHSLSFFDCIGQNPQVRAVLIGHTHRNRLRKAASSGATPYVEVQCTKDYPGGWAHYRLFEDGSFRQEVRRTSSERALTHSRRCRDFYNGFYRHFALGPLEARSFVVEAGSGR